MEGVGELGEGEWSDGGCCERRVGKKIVRE